MARCILHIGHAKTATTYLQHCLHLNEDLLLRQGWWVPSQFADLGFYDLRHLSHIGTVHSGNLAPLHELMSNGPGATIPAMHARLFASDQLRDGADLLLSSELFFYYPIALANVLRAATARGLRPEVIGYVDRQDHAAVASYLQNVRAHGFTGGIVDFLMHNSHMSYCRYLIAMDRLRAHAPDVPITLRSFAPAFLADGDVFTDLMHTIDPRLDLTGALRPPPGTNEGLVLEQYELLRAATLMQRPDAAALLAQSTGPLSREQRTRVRDFHYRPYVRQFILRQFMQHNDELLDRYLPQAAPDERSWWQQPDPAAGRAPEIDRSVLEALRTEAFAG